MYIDRQTHKPSIVLTPSVHACQGLLCSYACQGLKYEVSWVKAALNLIPYALILFTNVRYLEPNGIKFVMVSQYVVCHIIN